MVIHRVEHFFSIDKYINLKIDIYTGIFIYGTFPLFPLLLTISAISGATAPLVYFGSSSIGVNRIDIYTEQWRYGRDVIRLNYRFSEWKRRSIIEAPMRIGKQPLPTERKRYKYDNYELITTKENEESL